MSIFDELHDTELIWNRLIGLATVSFAATTLATALAFAVLPLFWASLSSIFYIGALTLFLIRWTAEATARIIGTTAQAQVDDLLNERGI